ncbi:hypothetical protein [Marinitoga aeolica]|uniref:Uncharacterized protein n=1 Tax=Marinitoga aeolica TaxID=2809031 RepID=A0ABY8PRV5_9BACT|nr:hypothetical protein [Marinitoga aeolica]WGS65384.1 hypothetical protein JRV97_02175 [Marinitoga aeolica]
MKNSFKQLMLIYLFIVLSFISLIFLIKIDIDNYEQKNLKNYLKNTIFQLDEKVKKNIEHYINYQKFTFKPFKLAIYQNDKIIYSDFKNINDNNFFYSEIEIKNKKYIYTYSLLEYIDYLNLISNSNIILKYNNKLFFKNNFYTNSSDSIKSAIQIFIPYKKMLFYIVPDKNLNILFMDKLSLYIIVNSILFFILFLILKKNYFYSIKDLNLILNSINGNNKKNIKLNTDIGISLKEKIDNIINTLKNKENKISELKIHIKQIENKNNSLINDLIFSINTPIQNLINSLNIKLSKDIEKSLIIKNISEINYLMEEFKNAFFFSSDKFVQNCFEFFDINKFHSELVYFLSFYLSKKTVNIKKHMNIKNSIVFSNKDKLYKVLYKILTLILKEKESGNIIISYSLIKSGVLEVKIIDKDNIFNDYILLLNKQIPLDKTDIKLYDIMLIKKYIKDLKGIIFLNQNDSDLIIKIEISVDYIDFIKNYDLNNLKNLYLTKLIESEYTVSQANKYIKEIIALSIDVLNNFNPDKINILKNYLIKNDFHIFYNWINFIIEYKDDSNVAVFKNLLIEKLRSL